MKFLVALLLLTLPQIALATPPKQITIKHRVSSETVNLFSLDKVKLVSQKYDPNDELGAEIVVEIQGIIEGNLCTYNAVGIEVVRQNTPFDPNPKHLAKLVALNAPAPEVDISTRACGLYSKPTPFTALLKAQVTAGFDSAATEMTMTYTFNGMDENDNPYTVTLKLVLDRKAGWLKPVLIK